MAPERPAFQSTQYGFAAHIRDPDVAPAPADVEDRRMAIYRRLFFNNMRTLLGWNFPRLRKLHSDDRWDALIRDYYSTHRASTPYFPRIAEEFLDYLQNERGMREKDPVFMLELAHYEWTEKALSIADLDLAAIEADPDGDLLDGVAIISPLAWSFTYRFPVHRIDPKYRPAEPPANPTHLVVCRDRNDAIRHLELNSVSARLLQLLKENADRSARSILEQISEELRHPDPCVVVERGHGILADFRQRDIILGTRPRPR